MFPTGVPGAGLFLLRLAAAAGLLLDGTGHWTLVSSWWTLLLFLVPATALCLGLLTPYGAFAAFVMESGALWVTGGQDYCHLLGVMAVSASVAMVGPGAYSVDARIFGRRLLNVPGRG